jgi:PilZ domain
LMWPSRGCQSQNDALSELSPNCASKEYLLQIRNFKMAFGMRKNERVSFERGFQVYIMGIDGTWRRDCKMVDVSQTGARLSVEDSIEGLDLKEFFLLLSSTGLAYRRCKLIRVMGDEIGVEFLAREKPKKKNSKK